MLEAALKPKPWIRYQKVSSRFAQIRARVNVERKKQKLAEITFRFHDLRHHFAVDYLKASGNIYDLQQILGPSSIILAVEGAFPEHGTLSVLPNAKRAAQSEIRVGTKDGTSVTVQSHRIFLIYNNGH